jgi:hypothetical protein
LFQAGVKAQEGALSNLSPLMDAPRGYQQPNRILTVFPCHLDELIQLIQDQLLHFDPPLGSAG